VQGGVWGFKWLLLLRVSRGNGWVNLLKLSGSAPATGAIRPSPSGQRRSLSGKSLTLRGIPEGGGYPSVGCSARPSRILIPRIVGANTTRCARSGDDWPYRST